VRINSIASKASANCDFEWLESSTPVVTNIVESKNDDFLF